MTHFQRVIWLNLYCMNIRYQEHTPGIALTETNVSAKCWSLFKKVDETREVGKVTTATAFDNRTTVIRDLTKESMSHS